MTFQVNMELVQLLHLLCWRQFSSQGCQHVFYMLGVDLSSARMGWECLWIAIKDSIKQMHYHGYLVFHFWHNWAARRDWWTNLFLWCTRTVWELEALPSRAGGSVVLSPLYRLEGSVAKHACKQSQSGKRQLKARWDGDLCLFGSSLFSLCVCFWVPLLMEISVALSESMALCRFTSTEDLFQCI